jgi:hypothetical protein
MDAWTPEELPQQLAAHQRRLDADIAEKMPATSGLWQRRTTALAPGADRTAYFLDLAAFPTVLLPRWLAPDAAPALHRDLLASSLAGYWAIRVVDQITDGDHLEDRQLAPVLGLLHARFWRPYHARFAPDDSAFWEPALRWWTGSADAAVAEASAPVHALPLLAQRKTGAVRIPLLALCRAAGAPSLPPTWEAVVDRLCTAHQLHNDWTDWRRDRAAGQRTWAGAWTEQHCGDRSPAEWWALEGAQRFAREELLPALAALRRALEAASTPGGVAWCTARTQQVHTQLDQLQRAQDTLARLLGGV